MVPRVRHEEYNHNATFLDKSDDDDKMSTTEATASVCTSSSSAADTVKPPIDTQTMVKAIKSSFKKMLKKSPFLRQPPPTEQTNRVAYFDRSEIEIGSRIGKGGFSEVYEIRAFHLDEAISNRLSRRNQALRQHFGDSVVDPHTGQSRFVLKHLRQSGWKSWKEFALAATDLLGEASFLIRLDHPNIIQLRGLPTASWSAYGDGSHDSFFLILDRLSETLDDRIQGWRQEALLAKTATNSLASSDSNHSSVHEKEVDDEDRCRDESPKLRYSQQIASALEYLHSKRLVFRDLKPNNLGFRAATGGGNAAKPGDDDQILLFDFGFCRQLPTSTSSSSSPEVYAMSCVGTVRYAAPETLRRGLYNAKVDVHAWALVVWEMFTLEMPFAAYNQKEFANYVVLQHERPPLHAAATMTRHQQRHGRPLGSVPRSLRAILVGAWHHDLRQRSHSWNVREAVESILLATSAPSQG